MKLLRIINKRYAVFSVILLLTGLVLIYYFLQYFISSEVVEKLENTKQNVIKSLDAGNTVEFYPLIEIKELKPDQKVTQTETVSDTIIYNPVEKEPDSYKQISFIYSRGDSRYLIYVRTDNIETADIMLSLGLPIFILILIILVVSNFIINRINFRIWQPFYENLGRLKNFSASDDKEILLTGSRIDEFRDLNSTLKELTNRIRKDYHQLKEFSENASHELQTPLSIIKIKIESMLQDEKLSNEQLLKIQSVYKMINRLSRLNRSLTLLSKLESVEYENKSKISLKEFLIKKIKDFSEITDIKGITVNAGLNSDIIIEANTDLLEILFTNLLSNAVKYNIENGSITVEITGNRLTISNTGSLPVKDTEKMFERFEKGEQSDESSGLGLTIARQICLISGFDIKYSFENSLHILEITFPQ
jgi:two-component system, OmpR family, sensor kinase